MKATQATLLTVDSTTREIVRKLDSSHHFIIEEIDPKHILILPASADLVVSEVERILAQNSYVLSQNTGNS